MKMITRIIIGLVVITISANLFLLLDKGFIKYYFIWVNVLTGFSLVSIVLLSLYSRKKLKQQQSNYVHKIFHKN
jgi:asparagine N-glycosylation enzyme membrane subunit Stt3